MSKILIAVPVWNRKKTTELCLRQIQKNKNKNTELWAYNDHSTEYDNDWLKNMCDEVIKLKKNFNKKVVGNSENKNGIGVQHLRWYQFRTFLFQNKFDYIYMTDNDAFHDPDFLEIMLYLYKKYKLPVSLYNSFYHSQKQNIKFENEEISMRVTAPGISMFFDKNMVEKIVRKLEENKEDPNYAWDYKCQEWLREPWITSKTSYLEHFGAESNSLHTQKGDWEKDKAINPTKYLASQRKNIINYLSS